LAQNGEFIRKNAFLQGKCVFLAHPATGAPKNFFSEKCFFTKETALLTQKKWESNFFAPLFGGQKRVQK